MFCIFIILSCPAKCKRFLKKIVTFETNLLYLEQGVLLLHLEGILMKKDIVRRCLLSSLLPETPRMYVFNEKYKQILYQLYYTFPQSETLDKKESCRILTFSQFIHKLIFHNIPFYHCGLL